MKGKIDPSEIIPRIYYRKKMTIRELYDLLTRQGRDFRYHINQYEQRGGDTALHAACMSGKTSIVAALLEMGADPNQMNDKEETPLSSAIQAQSLECVKLLVEHGAMLGYFELARGLSGSYISYAKRKSTQEIVSYLELATRQALPENNRTKESADHYYENENLLMKAVDANDIETVKKLLVDEKISPTRVFYPFSHGLLVRAILNGYVEIATLLADHGDDLTEVYTNSNFGIELAKMLTPDDDIPEEIKNIRIEEKPVVQLAREKGFNELADHIEKLQKSRYDKLLTAAIKQEKELHADKHEGRQKAKLVKNTELSSYDLHGLFASGNDEVVVNVMEPVTTALKY